MTCAKYKDGLSSVEMSPRWKEQSRCDSRRPNSAWIGGAGCIEHDLFMHYHIDACCCNSLVFIRQGEELLEITGLDLLSIFEDWPAIWQDHNPGKRRWSQVQLAPLRFGAVGGKEVVIRTLCGARNMDTIIREMAQKQAEYVTRMQFYGDTPCKPPCATEALDLSRA